MVVRYVRTLLDVAGRVEPGLADWLEEIALRIEMELADKRGAVHPDDGATIDRMHTPEHRAAVDATLYPDIDPPDPMDLGDRANYLARACDAIGRGIPPTPGTIELLRGWREIFDAFPLSMSPAYHALRARFWPDL